MKSFKLIYENVPVIGLPQKPINIGGGQTYTPGPNQRIRDVAKSYMKEAGMSYNPPKDYKTVDPERATRIANEFDKMKHDPTHPDVRASYDALAKETMAQFHHIRNTTGLKISFNKPGQDPYAKTPHLGAIDVRDNNHLSVFKTDHGFGSDNSISHENHPMLAKTGVHVDGHEMLVNDAFRVVHDYFGHYKEGFGFRANGEENAWRQHAAMYSPLARRAMTTETRGQNSFVNYGPHGESNRKANTENTVFAQQKVGLLPKFCEKD